MKTTDQTAKNLAARDLLGKRYVQMLREVPRGDVSAWMVCGCAIAAEAFKQQLSDWSDSSYGARVRGVTGYDGIPEIDSERRMSVRSGKTGGHRSA
ncbi:hypothetical protein [Paraburkholderia sp. SUR17]|uniref:hypothetical protein n=1 Tax=Paraburkholderia sp. SUR17 TaxID=3034358 RepID=UPI0024082B5C|nr:hypothetical protein [Paraburkholderia sp. SUR17]WEY37779.1 hypothetical protein P2869_11900 [Paraburkholderia sp. SUR17]